MDLLFSEVMDSELSSHYIAFYIAIVLLSLRAQSTGGTPLYEYV